MGDGWGTKLRGGRGHDWASVRRARRGGIKSVELDTGHVKGNAPGSCMVEYADAGASFNARTARWNVLLPETPLEAHQQHRWSNLSSKAATHVRLNIYPDGGVARLRLFGRVAS